MKPERIEELRKEFEGWEDGRELCELALDGLRFRFWIEAAAARPATVATEIARCITADQYRKAIDRLIVQKVRGGPLFLGLDMGIEDVSKPWRKP